VAKHVRSYVETGGENGHLYHGMPTLLLTTRGRKSGKLRRTALIHGQDGDRYLLVATNGGVPRHPAWYLNLVEHPDVGVQVGLDKFSARVRTATAEEKPRLWRRMAAILPRYDAYQEKAGREIPPVIVERVWSSATTHPFPRSAPGRSTAPSCCARCPCAARGCPSSRLSSAGAYRPIRPSWYVGLWTRLEEIQAGGRGPPFEEREGVAAEARALLEERPRTFSYLARPLDERFPGRNAFATGQTVCIRVYRAHCRV
jgi:deazaflavin-dependent oxidoreductase (nitroreductase family)